MKNILLTVILLAVPVSAHADWSNTQIRPAPAPNFIPSQTTHQVRVNVPMPQRVEPQHRVQQSQPMQCITPRLLLIVLKLPAMISVTIIIKL